MFPLFMPFYYIFTKDLLFFYASSINLLSILLCYYDYQEKNWEKKKMEKDVH